MRFNRMRAVTLATCALMGATAALAAPAGAHSEGMTLEGTSLFCDSPAAGRSQWGFDWRLTHHGGDMAFWGQTAVVSCGGDDDRLENDGFVVVDLSDPKRPRKVGAFQCAASASDIQIWNDLVFLAVDRNGESAPAPNPGPRGGSCTGEPLPRGREPLALPTDAELFMGVRVVSIADPANPVLVKNVRIEPRGAHTLSVVPDLDHAADGAGAPRLLLYTTSPGPPAAGRHGVVSMPLSDPAAAAEIAGAGFDLKADGAFNHCHDISIFAPRGLAACSGLEAGSFLYDLRDDAADPLDDGASPERPLLLAHVPRPNGTARHHGGAFSWDGDTLVVGDEISLERPVCDGESGRLWFYDVRDPRSPRLLASQPPHSYVGNLGCHPKQIGIIPLRDGRDVAVVSWAGGGTSLIEFTELNHAVADKRRPPREIAYEIGPQATQEGPTPWAAYWYDGFVFANNVWGCLGAGGPVCAGTKLRGLDVYTLHDPKLADAAPLHRFNYPTQECLAAAGWSRGALAPCGRR